MKKDIIFEKSIDQKIIDFVFTPFRFAMPDSKVEKMGLTSLRKERFNICLKYAKGKVLDIGCADNKFISTYRARNRLKSIGVDAYNWKGADIICDTTKLPFKDNSFDTSTIIASLNHIPRREKVLAESYRVLKPGGRILITMINPIISRISHTIVRKRFDRDQGQRGGMAKGEVYGFWPKEIISLLSRAGFKKIKKIPFIYGLNNLYIGIKGARR